MDIEARKLTIIEQFIRVQNVDIVSQFEKILKKVQKNDYSPKPFTLEELNIRINKSMKNSKNGELIDNDELISEIEKWN